MTNVVSAPPMDPPNTQDRSKVWEIQTADDDILKNQEKWIVKSWTFYENYGVHIFALEDGTEIYMLAERRYPLIRETLKRMMELRLTTESEGEAVFDLLRFILNRLMSLGAKMGGGRGGGSVGGSGTSPLLHSKELASPKKTALGKDISNPLIGEPLEADKSEIYTLKGEPLDTFLMKDEEIKLNHLKDSDDSIPIPRVSVTPLDSLDSFFDSTSIVMSPKHETIMDEVSAAALIISAAYGKFGAPEDVNTAESNSSVPHKVKETDIAQKDKKTKQNGQNRAREWKEHENPKPKAYLSSMDQLGPT
ncbi:hypothetical protein Tco_0156649 [Tanacetum coccineum]